MKLLFSILCPKPELRSTVKDVETNEWVTQDVDITQYKWENVIKNRTICGIKEPKSVHASCQNPRYGQRYLQKRKRRSDSIHNNKFFECNNSPELNSRIELKLRATATTPGQGVYRKGKRRSESIRNNKFIECNNSPELNWSIELKLEASPTSPSKKQMTDQDIWN
jgi:hypothetical protein